MLSEKNSFLQGQVNQLIIKYQIVGPENIHISNTVHSDQVISNIMHSDQVIFRNGYGYTYIFAYSNNERMA